MVGQRHIALRVQAHQVFHCDAQILHQVVVQSLFQLHLVGILHIVGLLVGLAVDIDDAILDLQRLTGQSYAAFYVVLATICRTGVNQSVFTRIAFNGLASGLIDGVIVQWQLLQRQRVGIGTLGVHLITYLVTHLVEVVGLILRCRADGIASREVEYDDVVQLHLTQTLYTTVVPVRPLDIALALKQGQRVLGQRHGQRGLGNTGAIAHLRYEQVVTRQQRLLQ